MTGSYSEFLFSHFRPTSQPASQPAKPAQPRSLGGRREDVGGNGGGLCEVSTEHSHIAVSEREKHPDLALAYTTSPRDGARPPCARMRTANTRANDGRVERANTTHHRTHPPTFHEKTRVEASDDLRLRADLDHGPRDLLFSRNRGGAGNQRQEHARTKKGGPRVR